MRDIREITVYSKKYEIEGKIIDAAGLVVKLAFEFNERKIEMGLNTSFLMEKNYEEKAVELIENYIERHQEEIGEERQTKLFYWYIEQAEIQGNMYLVFRGNVTGHPSLQDSMFIHTSPILNYHIDWDNSEMIAHTYNTEYHCPLIYCNVKKQEEKGKGLLLDFERIKKEYEGKIHYPTIEQGKVLLVISNFDDYYFHSLYYKRNGEKEPEKYYSDVHLGMFQDSFLISGKNCRLDIRYFPHHENIKFYSELTEGCPFYIENIGDIILYCKTSKGTIKLGPGERKEVKKENVEPKPPSLAGGDLYPAGICF